MTSGSCYKCQGHGQYYDDARRGFVLCDLPECKTERALARVVRYGFLAYGEPIGADFIDGLAQAGRVAKKTLEVARTKPHSVYLHGLTGMGKTLVLKAWYNRCLFDGIMPVYWRETKLFREFEDTERRDILLRSAQKQKMVFLDELWHPRDWNDASADRHFSGSKHSAFEDWIDAHYDRMDEVTFIVASNRSPEEAHEAFKEGKGPDPREVRRVVELCGQNIIHVAPAAGVEKC